jgi:hypothetical protein
MAIHRRLVRGARIPPRRGLAEARTSAPGGAPGGCLRRWVVTGEVPTVSGAPPRSSRRWPRPRWSATRCGAACGNRTSTSALRGRRGQEAAQTSRHFAHGVPKSGDGLRPAKSSSGTAHASVRGCESAFARNSANRSCSVSSCNAATSLVAMISLHRWHGRSDSSARRQAARVSTAMASRQ